MYFIFTNSKIMSSQATHSHAHPHVQYISPAAVQLMMEIPTAPNAPRILTTKNAGPNGTPIHPLYSILLLLLLFNLCMVISVPKLTMKTPSTATPQSDCTGSVQCQPQYTDHHKPGPNGTPIHPLYCKLKLQWSVYQGYLMQLVTSSINHGTTDIRVCT